MKRDVLVDAVKVVAVVAIVAPLVPEPRVLWWCAMRMCQNAARHFGLLALEAENRYRKEIE